MQITDFLPKHPNMNKRFLLIVSAIIIIGIAATMFFYDRVMDIKVPYTISSHVIPADNTEKPVVAIGVISRYPPNVIMNGYQPIMDYLSSATGYRFELKLSTNYEQTLQQLVRGDVAAAFFGSYLYVKSHEIYNITPVLKPLNENMQPFFRSVLIAPVTSSINSVPELRGKRIALPSRESFSGNWLISYELQKFHISPAELKEVQHFAHHHSVVYQVLKGNFDAGVVRDYLANQYLNRGLKIITTSEPIAGSPIVVSVHSNPAQVKAITEALLAINLNNPAHVEMLRHWDKEFTHGFISAHDTDYNFIRSIMRRESAK